MDQGPGTPGRGVTLLEMLVVLAIVGLIVSISLPSIAAGIDSVRLRTATSSVASFINAAVTRVERRRQPIELIISAEDNSIQLLSNEPGFTRELKMPDGVSIEAVVMGVNNEPGGAHHLLLLPGATAPGIEIQLANRHGTRRLVKLDPMTGFPRVENVENK
jgi:prepilin-type N-terminal cleavage/methylation domain-containing protein